MSEEKKTKAFASTKGKSSKKRKAKDKGLLPYITTPLIFVLISLVIILPMFIAFMNYSVGVVHSAQKTLVKDYYDVSVSTERFDNNKIDYNGYIGACEKVGVVECKEVGMKSDVYYGINRISLRNGAALSSQSVFDGHRSKINIAGYSSSEFKGMNNISEGDKITFETTDKIYEYSVISNSVSKEAENFYGGRLVLSCEESSNAFSAFNSEKRYVVASFSSVRTKGGA